jgi:hypothetical protein
MFGVYDCDCTEFGGGGGREKEVGTNCSSVRLKRNFLVMPLEVPHSVWS